MLGALFVICSYMFFIIAISSSSTMHVLPLRTSHHGDMPNPASALSPQLTRPASRSPSSKARVTIKNRRKRYLDTHPEYFSSPSIELAGLGCS